MSDYVVRSFSPLKIGELEAKVPVIQGGMGVGISLSGLAGAVASCGGIGVISAAQIGYRSEDFYKDSLGSNLRALKEEIRKARTIAGNQGIIGVNIMVATQKYEEYVKAAVEAGAELIISGAGLPMTLPELTKGYKTKIVPIVSSLKSAQVIMKYWKRKYDRLPDLVVIEGPLAGGHLGFKDEELSDIAGLNYEEKIKAMIQYIKAAGKEKDIEIPVVVAGGLYTRQDAEHCLFLGADGVQMATRFVTTYECDASDAFKQAYIDAQKEDIILVKSPVQMPARAIANHFIQRTQMGRISPKRCSNCIITCNPAETPYCITEALIHAAKGNLEEALLFCGTNAYRANKLEYVKDIMHEFE